METEEPNMSTVSYVEPAAAELLLDGGAPSRLPTCQGGNGIWRLLLVGAPPSAGAGRNHATFFVCLRASVERKSLLAEILAREPYAGLDAATGESFKPGICYAG